MDSKELRKVAKVMKDFGITHFKNAEFELSISADVVFDRIAKTRKRRAKATDEVDEEIQHKIEELNSVMKIGDNDLVDRLFPDHTQDEESA